MSTAGYSGPLYIEIAPQTFSVLVRAGTRLNQLRLKRGEPAKLATRSVGVDLLSDTGSSGSGGVAMPVLSTWTTRTATTRATTGSRWRPGTASCCWTRASSTSWPRQG